MNNIIQHYPKHLRNDLKSLIAKFNEVKFNDKVIDLKFVDQGMLQIIEELSNSFSEVEVLKLYNYENEERIYTILKPHFFEVQIPNICFLNVNYNKKYYKLEHRHVLGTILNNDIDFKLIGDIIVDDEDNIQIICASDVISSLEENCAQISNATITYEKVDYLLESSKQLEYKQYYVSSLRIDTLVKNFISKNRNYAQKLIMQKYVKVNQIQINSNTKTCKLYDIISIRGFGRFKIISVDKLSSGKYKIAIEY